MGKTIRNGVCVWKGLLGFESGCYPDCGEWNEGDGKLS